MDVHITPGTHASEHAGKCFITLLYGFLLLIKKLEDRFLYLQISCVVSGTVHIPAPSGRCYRTGMCNNKLRSIQCLSLNFPWIVCAVK